MNRKLIFYAVFFIALVIAFFVVLTKLVPGFATPSTPPISYVQPFSFIDQDGKQFTDKDVAGKVYVAEFFFTTCTGICPKLNSNMHSVFEKFKNEKDFLILSHTCDPATDSASRLKQYADSLQVSGKNWIFLTGRKDSLYNQARVSYKLDDPKNNLTKIEDDFLHTQFFALVNKKGEVKYIYDGLKPSEIELMNASISKMLKE